MKQRKQKSLILNKETVSNLNGIDLSRAMGGVSATISMECCANPGPGKPGPIDLPTIDIPTINDSCFSWCADKCNDF